MQEEDCEGENSEERSGDRGRKEVKYYWFMCTCIGVLEERAF